MPEDAVKVEDKKDESAKTLMWMPYGDIAKILFGLLVGIAATIFTSYWNAKEAKLFYSVSPPMTLDNVSVVSITLLMRAIKRQKMSFLCLAFRERSLPKPKLVPIFSVQ